MARLPGPDANSRLVYVTSGSLLRSAAGRTATVYADASGTSLADIAAYNTAAPTVPGPAITGSTLTVDGYSMLPLFWFPTDGTDSLYVIVNGGPLTKINADYDARLDAVTTAATAAIPMVQKGAAGGVATLDVASHVPSAELALTAGDIPALDAAKVTTGAFAAPRIPDATAGAKGAVQLAGDLGGAAGAPTVPGLAGKASTSHTHDSAYLRKATQRAFNALDNTVANCAGDDTTDDAAAFNALVVALTAMYAADGITRAIYAPTARYLLRSAINWQSGVSLLGDGPGSTILRALNGGVLTSGFSAILCDATGGRTSANPLVDCTFRDFEIDGSGVVTGSYDYGSKGINILWMTRARFDNLYIHGCNGSGLGCDHLTDSLITRVLAVGNGRQNNGTQPGGAGIGIGCGDNAVMQLTVANCITRNNGTHGIFLEHQHGDQPTQAKGIRIVGCHAEGNKWGISDWGADATLIAGNTVLNNTSHGVYVHCGVAGATFVGKGTQIQNNVINGNAGAGVCIEDAAAGRVTVEGNRIAGNSLSGVLSTNALTSATHPELRISRNRVFANGYAGIRLAAPTGDIEIAGNRCNNNGTNTGLGPPRAGIQVEAAATNPTVTDNVCHDNQGTKTQTHGLYFTAAATNTGVQVERNNLQNNLTGAAQFDAAIGSGGIVRDNLGYASSSDTPAATDVQVFAPGASTWTKPAGAKTVTVTGVAGGGGGGSGRRGAAGSVRCGGGGGGGGGTTRITVPASALTATVTVTVGAGGTGAAAVSADNTDGGSGATGGNTTFGAYLRSTGGGGGGGGTNAAGTAGFAGTGTNNGGAAGAASATGGAGNISATGIAGATGGGSGGGVTSADVAGAGGNGSGSSTGDATVGAGGVVGGAGAGAGSSQPAGSAIPGGGGGGGAASTTATGQAGGAGGSFGAGAGGGGASVNGNNSGAGATGGAGTCVVTTYF